jgi:uncharacterized membrane protein
MTAYSIFLLLHLLGLTGFGGGIITQFKLMKASASSLPASSRDAVERLMADTVTRLQLPAIFLSVASGVALLILKPALLRNGGMHLKLTLVVILLVLSHLEMFNARRIVRARTSPEERAAAEIDRRMNRHALYARLEAVLTAAILLIVAFQIRA